jgi:hypothetical protein
VHGQAVLASLLLPGEFQEAKMARNVKHTDKVLQKASDYLEYHIHTFASSIDVYQKTKPSEAANAAVDSICVQARLLIDFFFFTDGEKTDVLAIDYFWDQNPKPYYPKIPMPKYLVRERRKVNQRIAHLTTHPMPYLRSSQKYNIRKFAKPIVRAFRAWLKAVPDSRLHNPKKTRADYAKHLARIDKLVP